MTRGLRFGLACGLLACLPGAALLLPDEAAAARPRDPDLKGPMSDFWPRVKRDWSRRLTGLNRGPLQTAIWVAMIWEGPDEEILPVEDLARLLQEREAARWLRAQITRHRWSRIREERLARMQAMRQNIILVGTPEDNPLVARALEPTPLRVDRGTVTIAGRRVPGEGLLVMAIAPNPVDPRHYALIFTGTSPPAVAEAAGAPFGSTDYLVLQGDRVIEQGMFRWEDGRPSATEVIDARSFIPHFGWDMRPFGRVRLRHDPRAWPGGALERAGRALDAALEEAARFYALPGGASGPVDVWLYPSLEEKVAQSGDGRLAHLETATGAVHAVISPAAPAPPEGALALCARRLLQQAGETWGMRADRELPGLAAAAGLIWQESFETISLDDWASRSTRDPGEVPMSLLLSRPPDDPHQGKFWLLDAASFLRRLALSRGVEPLSRWYRAASRSDLHEAFRQVYGISLREAEQAWLADVASVATARGPAPRHDPPGSTAGAAGRLAGEPAARGAELTRRAQAAFRAGEFEPARALAAQALGEPGISPEDRAWATVTMGRAHARLGRPAAAIAALRDEAVREGPGVVRVLADYWLETLGRPLNGRAARDLLMREAEVSLMSLDWEKAEASLLAALAMDPRSRSAHARLGQVYLSKFQYWYDFALLDRELHPGESSADPYMFQYLEDKGREELRRAEALPGETPGAPEGILPEVPEVTGEDMASSHFLSGKARFLTGDLEGARREMETVLALDRGRGSLPAYARLYLARVALARGQPDEARRELETILRMNPTGLVTKLAREALRRLDPPPP